MSIPGYKKLNSFWNGSSLFTVGFIFLAMFFTKMTMVIFIALAVLTH